MHQKLLSLSACLLILLGGSFVNTEARQLDASTLRGVVKDQQGAVIQGATVRAKQAATGATREARTNDEGLYVLTNLQPGEYEISVESAGFKKMLQAGVVLQVGQNLTLDHTLAVGEIDVSDDLMFYTPLVDTASSKVDRVIEGREI